MISSSHILTGAALGLAVGQTIPNPVVAVPVAFAVGLVSHHILDSLPHTDPGSFRSADNLNSPVTDKELIFVLPDNIIATAFVLAVFYTLQPSWPMLFGALGGNLPDVWHNVGAWADLARHRVLPGYFRFHEAFHTTARGSLIPLGIATDALAIILPVWYLLSR